MASIREKMLKLASSYFHRTKKFAFSVTAKRLDKCGLLPGERGIAKPKKR